jgi:hypothetical protein
VRWKTNIRITCVGKNHVYFEVEHLWKSAVDRTGFLPTNDKDGAAVMKQFTGCLRKTIDLAEAPARDLRRCFSLPPDESDLRRYAISEAKLRFAALDQFFELDSNAHNIWEQRAKALLARKYKIDPSGPDWSAKLTYRLAIEHVPGFSLKRINKKRHGAPREWTNEQFADLFADVESLKRTTKLSVKQICEKLPSAKSYVKRWGCYRPPGLRKQYLKAKSLSRGLLFRLVLCGLAAVSIDNVDLISAAIEQRALKCPLK